MIANEKYKGDCHLQKTYTPPGKRGKTIKNDGAVQSYYVEDNHPAIISRELWEQAQEEVRGRYRRNDRGKKRTKDPLSGDASLPHMRKEPPQAYGIQKDHNLDLRNPHG